MRSFGVSRRYTKQQGSCSSGHRARHAAAGFHPAESASAVGNLRQWVAGGESLRRWDISHDGLFRFHVNRAKSPGSSGFHPRLPVDRVHCMNTACTPLDCEG